MTVLSRQVPKDTVALLETDLRRNLTALLADSVPAALTHRLVHHLTGTVGPPLVDRLAAILEAGLPERMLRPLHARTVAPLLVTLPDRLKRSLLSSLTHTLSHSLSHVLVPTLGEALLVEGIKAAGGDSTFPIPLTDACASCPRNHAIYDKAVCVACRRDEFRYWVLHRSHCEFTVACDMCEVVHYSTRASELFFADHADYFAEYYRSFYTKAAESAYKDIPLKEGGSYPTSSEVAAG
jgi:hypothetical protein